MLRVLALFLVCLPSYAGLPENPQGSNKALLVGVSQGLPGLSYDIDKMKAILSHPANGFSFEILRDSQGTVANIAKKLTELSEAVDSRGSFLFYFTGHGNKNVVLAQDRTMKITEIRTALEEGRKDWGPMQRLVMMFDSCYSGSLLNPLALPFSEFPPLLAVNHSADMADALFEAFSPTRNRDTYWQKLFVVASASANETCEASGTGSAFTNALAKAFDQTIETGVVSEFISKTKSGTKGSHPTERLEPATINQEKMWIRNED